MCVLQCVEHNIWFGGRLHTECTSVHDWPMPTVHTYVHMYVCMYVCNVVYHGNTTCSSKYLKRAMAIPKRFFQGTYVRMFPDGKTCDLLPGLLQFLL